MLVRQWFHESSFDRIVQVQFYANDESQDRRGRHGMRCCRVRQPAGQPIIRCPPSVDGLRPAKYCSEPACPAKRYLRQQIFPHGDANILHVECPISRKSQPAGVIDQRGPAVLRRSQKPATTGMLAGRIAVKCSRRQHVNAS